MLSGTIAHHGPRPLAGLAVVPQQDLLVEAIDGFNVKRLNVNGSLQSPVSSGRSRSCRRDGGDLQWSVAGKDSPTGSPICI